MSSSTAQSTTQDEQDLEVQEESVADQAEVEDEETLSLNVVYDILKNKRRRHVLHLLEEAEDSTTLGDLAEQIAAIENDKPRTHLNAQERKRVYVGLYQCHLPRMDDAGVIDFDGDRGTVELGEYSDQVYEHLQTAEDDEEAVEWPKYYGLYGVGGAVLGTGFALAAPTTIGLVGMVLLLFGVVALAGVHYAQSGE